MSDSSDDSSITRRGVLQGLAATGATAAGAATVSGSAGAESTAFSDRETRTDTFETETEELRAVMAEQGFIESADLEGFDLETEIESDAVVEATTDVSGYRAGSETLTVSGSTDSADFVVFAEPSDGRSYAVLEDADGTEFVVDPDHPETVLELSSKCWDDGTQCGEICKRNCGWYSYIAREAYKQRCCFSGYEVRCYKTESYGCDYGNDHGCQDNAPGDHC